MIRFRIKEMGEKMEVQSFKKRSTLLREISTASTPEDGWGGNVFKNLIHELII